MAPRSVLSKKKKKLSRAEKAELTYQRLMESAAAVVGEVGYANATIAKIADGAGIAHGTFYNYFYDRQALFDALLPHVGVQMVDAIVKDTVGQGADREVARFRAFCDYLRRNPGFYRILFEAEVFAPKAHAEHIDRLVRGYRGALDRAVERKEITGYKSEELDSVIFMLLGMRSYVAMRFVSRELREGSENTVPETAINAYEKLVRRGLFSLEN